MVLGGLLDALPVPPDALPSYTHRTDNPTGHRPRDRMCAKRAEVEYSLELKRAEAPGGRLVRIGAPIVTISNMDALHEDGNGRADAHEADRKKRRVLVWPEFPLATLSLFHCLVWGGREEETRRWWRRETDSGSKSERQSL